MQRLHGRFTLADVGVKGKDWFDAVVELPDRSLGKELCQRTLWMDGGEAFIGILGGVNFSLTHVWEGCNDALPMGEYFSCFAVGFVFEEANAALRVESVALPI